MLVAFVVLALAVMIRGGAMRLCGVLVMLGRFRVGFLRHFRPLAGEVCRLSRRRLGERHASLFSSHIVSHPPEWTLS